MFDKIKIKKKIVLRLNVSDSRPRPSFRQTNGKFMDPPLLHDIKLK